MKDLARRCADAMWAQDRASQGLGLSLDEIGPGRAVLSMVVGAAMVNGHGICHGGFIFTLADSAFAFACNSANERHVAQHCGITFLRPAREGDRLVATAREVARAKRSGLYDVEVATAAGEVVAQLRGHSRASGGAVLPAETTDA